MKLFVVFLASVALCAGNAIPQIPKDNSHYVDGESRYIWMSQDDGELVLVDLEEKVENASEMTRNGANNQYWLYTRNNPTSYQLLVHGNLNSVLNSNYRADRPTVVIAHGWTNNGNSASTVFKRQALVAAQDANVIVVDWNGVAGQSYTAAVNGVPSVGQFLGNFLSWLLSSAGGNWNNVHLVGYSLGAHVIGNAGRAVNGLPSRLTGLDPAGPLWNLNNNRLNINDGQYVEAIHTDSGVQGYLNPLGDVDFYPNGGRDQPGCSSSGCNHARSYEFFCSSLPTEHLIGRLCGNLNTALNNQCTGPQFRLGLTALNKRGSGIFAMSTGASWPY